MGDAEAVKSLNDCEDIPPEVLRDHPHIETFSKAFAAFLPQDGRNAAASSAVEAHPRGHRQRHAVGAPDAPPVGRRERDGARLRDSGEARLPGTASPPLTMDINGAPHAVVQEEHDYMVRGLALARLCPTGSLDVVVTCMDGVEGRVHDPRAGSPLPMITPRQLAIYIRGPPPVRVRPSTASARKRLIV